MISLSKNNNAKKKKILRLLHNNYKNIKIVASCIIYEQVLICIKIIFMKHTANETNNPDFEKEQNKNIWGWFSAEK